MEKKTVDNLKNLPLDSTITQSLQCTGSATGNLRNKCALKPGHSLMDWIRLGNSGTDLSGTGGRLMSVSKEDLAKHNTINDAWMAIRGVVYNVTQYMDFHPGGVEELMLGVGSDATKLFNEKHPWVNYSQVLNKCIIGPLANPSKLKADHEQLPTPIVNNPFANPKTQNIIIPRLDWIQKLEEITLYFYTKQFCNPGSLVVNNIDHDNRIEIWILVGLYVHKYDFELQGRIKWPPKNVEISTESGKIEVKFNKHKDNVNLWSDLGKYKALKTIASDVELGRNFEMKLLSKNKFNNDSYCLLFKSNNVIYSLPVGYHLITEGRMNGTKTSKCYTPVPKRYTNKYINVEIGIENVYFLIKHYRNSNSFSQYLCDLENDARILVSLPKGKLNLSTLAVHRKFCFLAAGSGLTPFLGLLDHLLNRNTNRIEVVKLFYFNKTKSDIWCQEILANRCREDKRFEFVNILSGADDSWSGLRGRVSSELLYPMVNKSMESVAYIVACGPSGFIKCIENILEDLNFPLKNLFIF